MGTFFLFFLFMFHSRLNNIRKKMEIEIKLRLKGKTDYDKLINHMENDLKIERNRFLNQENVFFDGKLTQLKQDKAICRLRFFSSQGKDKCVCTVKQRGFVNDLFNRLNVTDVISLGGFKNDRIEYPFSDHLIELDHTKFEFGDTYELEMETENPEKLRPIINELLKNAGCEYTESKHSKFLNFIKGSIDT